MRRGVRMRAAQAHRVSQVFARHARLTRRGVPVRCQRSQGRRRDDGPVIFPSPAAAQAAADELSDIGEPFTPRPCIHGRHWHLQPLTTKESSMPHLQREPLNPDDAPSWLLSRDGDKVRAEVRARIGDEQPDPPEFEESCTSSNCYSCRKAARMGSVG